ncbi:MAG TPA: TlpA disulfide reductase family protein [Puia sp.]
MKYRIILSFILIAFSISKAPAQIKSGYIITGQIKGLKEGEKVRLLFRNEFPIWGWSHELIDSCRVKNGEFNLHGFILDAPRLVTLEFMGHHKEIQQPFPDFLMGNEKVYIHGTINSNLLLSQSITIEGSQSNDEQKRLQPFFDIWRYGLCEKVYNNLQEIKDSVGYNKDIIQGIEDTKNALIAQIKGSLFRSTSNQAAVPFFFIDCFDQIGHDSIVPVLYNKLDDQIKNSYYGKLINSRLYLCNGQPAPDFMSTQPDGTTISLKNIISNNKLTLVDFWGSGCGPCRKEFKTNTVALYNEFHNKGLEILGVSYDTNEKSWKKAIAEDHLPWLNVSTLKGCESDPALSLYKILHAPQNVLIDQMGKIIAWNVFGLELHWYLDKYFNQNAEKSSVSISK